MSANVFAIDAYFHISSSLPLYMEIYNRNTYLSSHLSKRSNLFLTQQKIHEQANYLRMCFMARGFHSTTHIPLFMIYVVAIMNTQSSTSLLSERESSTGELQINCTSKYSSQRSQSLARCLSRLKPLPDLGINACAGEDQNHTIHFEQK